MIRIFGDGVIYPLGRSEELSEAEYQIQYEMCRDAGRDDTPPALLVKHGQWGRTLHVRDMTAQHLRNAIALFRRSGWGEHPKIYELRLELARRGETE